MSKLPDRHLFEIRLLQVGLDKSNLLAVTDISRGRVGKDRVVIGDSQQGGNTSTQRMTRQPNTGMWVQLLGSLDNFL
jgi:hypothetical protein